MTPSGTTSHATAPTAPLRRMKFHAVWLPVGMVLHTVVLAWASLRRHWNLESAEDLAMFDQMLWSVRHGQGLISSTSGNGFLQFAHHFFGEHVSPILYLLAWPAALTPGPEALLVMQALALTLAALPLYRLTLLVTQSRRLATCTAFGWLLQPTLWGAVLYDFHMEALEGLFLFCFAWAFLRGHWVALLWAALYAACKEDAPIYLAAAAFLLGWKFQRWRLGLWVATGALLYALAAVLWIGPAFSPTGKHLLVGRMLTPVNCGGLWAWISAVLLHPDRWMALTGPLLAMGLLPLLGGRLLIPAALAVGVMWIARGEAQALMLIHYPLTVYPLLFLAGVVGLARLATVFSHARHPVGRRWVVIGVSVSFLVGLALTWDRPADRIRELGLGREGGGLAAARALHTDLAALPADQPITVLPTLAAHIARRQQLNVLWSLWEADWLVLRLDGQGHPFHPGAYHEWLNKLLSTNSPYGVFALAGERVVVLRRGHPRDLNRQAQRYTRSLEAEYLSHKIGHGVVDYAAQNGVAWEASKYERHDWVMFGPYIDLPPGRYRVGFRVKAARLKSSNAVTLEVTARRGIEVLGEIVLDRPTCGYEWREVDVALTSAGLEFRCWKPGYGNIRLDAVRWRKLD